MPRIEQRDMFLACGCNNRTDEGTDTKMVQFYHYQDSGEYNVELHACPQKNCYTILPALVMHVSPELTELSIVNYGSDCDGSYSHYDTYTREEVLSRKGGV